MKAFIATGGICRVAVFSLLFLIFAEASHGASRKATAAEEVSLVQLIATPERFDGKKIIVVGVYKLEFESFALYLNKDDARLLIRANSVALGIFEEGLNATKTKEEWERLNDSYVRVVGIFRHAPSGHMNLWRSEVVRISSISAVTK